MTEEQREFVESVLSKVRRYGEEVKAVANIMTMYNGNFFITEEQKKKLYNELEEARRNRNQTRRAIYAMIATRMEIHEVPVLGSENEK